MRARREDLFEDLRSHNLLLRGLSVIDLLFENERPNLPFMIGLSLGMGIMMIVNAIANLLGA